MPPLKLVIDALLHAVLPGFLAAAVVFGVLLLVVGRRAASVASALAVPAGVAAADWFRRALEWPSGGPGWKWLPAVALGALAVELLARVPRVPNWVGWLLRAGAAFGAARLLLSVELRELIWTQAIFAAVVLGEWAVLEAAATRAPFATAPWAAALCLFGASMVLLHAHTARLSEIALMSGAAYVGIGLVAWLGRAPAGAAAPAAAVLLPGTMLSGFTDAYSDVPEAAFALAGLAPLALAIGFVPPLRRWSGLKGLDGRLLPVLLVVAAAVALAMWAESLEGLE